MPSINGIFQRIVRLQNGIDGLDQKIRAADSRVRRRGTPLDRALVAVDNSVQDADARIRGAAHGPTCPVALGEPALPAGPEPQKKGTHCIPCSANHLSVCGGLLGEALRFARADGLGSSEVTDRVGMCLDELNAMERVDLRAEVVFKLPPSEKAVAEKALVRGRALRHTLEHLANVDGLEKAAAESQQLRGELFKDWWKLKYQALSPAEQAKLKEAVAALGEKSG